MTRAFSLLLLMTAVLALPSVALADGSVFTVRDVAVDATSTGAAQARDIAIAQGQQVAFTTLMHRLTRQQDWSSLPQESPDDIAGLVLGFEVSQEHASSTRYIAKVIYRFKPDAVRALLRNAQIPFSEARARAALVLPVYESPTGTVLWADPNPWRDAWTAHGDLADALVPLMLPIGDLGDSTLISAAKAKTASWSDVAQIAAKYGLDRVMIADAATDGAGNLSVRVTQLSADQPPSETQFSFAGGGDLTTQLGQAVDSALNRLYAEWKAATIVSFGQQNTLVAAVSFTSLDDWLKIRRRLAQAPTITGVDLLAISPLGAQVRVHYAGTTDQLQITLQQMSLALNGQAPDWQLSLAGAGTPQSPASGPASDVKAAPAGTSTAGPEFWNLDSPPGGAQKDSSATTQPVQGGVDPNLVTKVPPSAEAH